MSKEKPKVESGNPYLDAREEWLERYGSYISRAAQWRIAAFCALLLALISLTGNVAQVLQRKVIPYVVEVEGSGSIAAVKKTQEAGQPPERVIQAAVAMVIVNWRTVTVDTDLQKRMVGMLSVHTAKAATGTLKQWFGENDPYQIAKSGKLVQVEVNGLPLPVSKNSYRVEWIETVRSHTGAQLEQQHYEAIATVEIIPPEKEETILKNPCGVYVTQLSAAKILKQ